MIKINNALNFKVQVILAKKLSVPKKPEKLEEKTDSS